MRHAIATLPLLALALACADAPAAQSKVPSPPPPWRLLAATEDLAFSVDTSRAHRSDHLVSAWLRFDYGKPQDTPRVDGGPFHRTDLFVEFDCAAQTALTRQMHLFRQDGTQLVDFAFPNPTQEPIASHPMTIYYSAVCDRRSWFRG